MAFAWNVPDSWPGPDGTERPGVWTDPTGGVHVKTQDIDGSPHTILIPPEAIGARMALYGLDTPQEAFDAILREHGCRLCPDIDLPPTPLAWGAEKFHARAAFDRWAREHGLAVRNVFAKHPAAGAVYDALPATTKDALGGLSPAVTISLASGCSQQIEDTLVAHADTIDTAKTRRWDDPRYSAIRTGEV